MKFELTFLGTNSALPAHGRFPSAQVLKVHHHMFLIDCGEGTQARMLEYNVKRHQINQIFISHLHGDHVFGLIGLLTSFNLIGREHKLEIFAPQGLKEMIDVQLRYSKTLLTFPLEVHTVNTTQFALLFENDEVEIFSIPLIHRIPTNGFLFREKKRPPNIISVKIETYQLSVPQILAAKRGEDVILNDGRRLPNSELTQEAPEPRSYAYCSDTLYTETILPYIEGIDLLYHEATFLDEGKERAKITMHSTTTEAAEIAKKAGVRLLLLGHYSSRHKDITLFEKEAQDIFPATIGGREGMIVDLPYHREEAEPKIILTDPE